MEQLWTETADEIGKPHLLRILDRTGHTTIAWETSADTDAIGAANTTFLEKMAAGWMAIQTDADGGSPVAVKTFDETASRTLLQPPMVGG